MQQKDGVEPGVVAGSRVVEAVAVAAVVAVAATAVAVASANRLLLRVRTMMN